ncbi:uncharacterized protein RHO17_014858 [Thomomys bottae]
MDHKGRTCALTIYLPRLGIIGLKVAVNICLLFETVEGNVSTKSPFCEHHTLEVLISEPSANVCDVTTFPATAVCDSNIDICTNGKDPTELGTKELTKSEDNDLTTVVFHSNEDNSNCTSAFEFCSAHDDDSVTERDDTTLTAIAVCDSRINIWDTSSYTTTKLDETNNDEGSDDSPAFGLSFGEKQLRKQQVNVSKEGVEQTWKVENQIA